MSTQANPLSNFQLSPLPIPDSQPVQMQPARPPEPQPTQAGYAHKAGQGANIIANFLQGMAAGKAYKEQKEAKAAQTEVTNAQSQYQFLQGVASDPDQSDEKRAQAAKLLPGAWTDMIAAYQKYVGPSEKEQQGKSKVRKVGERLTRGVRAEKPVLIGDEQFEMLKKMGPLMSMPQQPTAQQKEEHLRVQNLDTQSKRMDTASQELDEANKMIAAGDLRDPEKRQKVLERITMAQNTLGNVSPKDLPDPLKEKLDKAATEAATVGEQMKTEFSKDAMQAYAKQKRGEPLTEAEQRALDLFLPPGKPPDPLSIFMKLKGQEIQDPLDPGRKRKINDDRDAYNAFLDNEAAAAARAKQADFNSQQQPVKDALKAKWRTEHGGQEPTKGDLESAWLNLYTAAGGGKAATEKEKELTVAQQKEVGQSTIGSVSKMYGGKWSRFFMDRNRTTDPKTGKTVEHGSPDYTMLSRNDFNAEDQKEWDKAAQATISELQNRGLSLDQISTIVGREAVERALQMSPRPDQQGGAGGAGKARKVKISYLNPATKKQETQEVELTADMAAIKKEFEGGGYQNVSVEEVK